jgi:anti-anti-sigma factor
MSVYRQLRVVEVGSVTVIRFANSKIVDEAEIQELGSELFSLVEQESRESLLLNFEDVKFLSSAALGKLIKLDKIVKSNGGELKLANIRPEILEVFAITRLDKLFDIKGSESEALAAF